MKKYLEEVISYLKGKIDIYDGHHEKTINAWNEVWDEMNFLGYNPQTINGIRKYIIEQLQE